jgi:hypothetical protein
MTNEINDILSSGCFRKIIAGQAIQIAEINASVALLIKADIAFDLSFTPGDQRIAKELAMRIYITPAVSIRITVQFEAGSTVL